MGGHGGTPLQPPGPIQELRSSMSARIAAPMLSRETKWVLITEGGRLPQTFLERK